MSKLTNKQIVNELRSELNAEFQSIVPEATSETGAEVLTILNTYPTQKNIFINTLINKVTMSVLFNEKWANPLKAFKKGTLPFGSSIEQLFVSDAERKAFGAHFTGSQTDEGDVLGKVVPKVNASYITVNFMNKYKVSISDSQLQTAFVSQNGLSNLVGSLIQSIYEAAEVDEYEYMKYCVYDMIGSAASNTGTWNTNAANQFILNGALTTVFEPKVLLSKLRAISGRLNFKSTKYNIAGVKTFTKREKLVLLVTPEVLADLDVNALAVLFNLSKGEVDYRIVEVDELPKFTTNYQPPQSAAGLVNQETGETATQTAWSIATAYQNIQLDAIVVDDNAFAMYDTVIQTRSVENPNSLSTNIIHHRQGIAGGNPYANFICFGHKIV